MALPDLRRFVGIPFADGGRDFASCDCWGLVRLVYREVLGVDLPSHDTVSALGPERADVLAGGAAEPEWAEAPERGARFPEVVLLMVGGRPLHVGLCLGGGRFLHVQAGERSRVARLDDPEWASRRRRCCRHRALAG